MLRRISLASNGHFSPPGGYPTTLSAGGATVLEGAANKTATSFGATVSATLGATVTLSLYSMPSTVGGSDTVILSNTDTAGVTTYAQVSQNITATETTLSLDLPSWATSPPYLVRLSATGITGSSFDTVARDTSITDTTIQPKVAGSVTVSDFYVITP